MKSEYMRSGQFKMLIKKGKSKTELCEYSVRGNNMSGTNSKGRRMGFNKSFLRSATKSIIRTVDMKNIRLRGKGLIDPSVGKLRAWADPFRGVNGVIGVSY